MANSLAYLRRSGPPLPVIASSTAITRAGRDTALTSPYSTVVSVARLKQKSDRRAARIADGPPSKNDPL